MKTMVRYRTECNGRSKYFTEIAAALMHFQVCMAKRKSVELWLVETTEKYCGVHMATQELSTQTLIDRADFN